MSPPVLRPSRTTPNLDLPIPGDAGPADYVTDTGALADAIDESVQPRVPLIAPADLSQPPYTTPYNGQVVDVNVDSANGIIWRFVWRQAPDAYGWRFIGGAPLIAFSSANAWGDLNAWASTQPVLTVPRPGIYRGLVKGDGVNTGTTNAHVYLSIDRSGNPNVPISGNAFGTFAPQTRSSLVHAGETPAMAASELIRTIIQVTVSTSTNGTLNRFLQVTPVRVS